MTDATPDAAPFQGFPPLHDLSRVPAGPVLVVAPHPDDEIIGCGGVIALHHDRGDRVHVALVTGGEAGGQAGVRLAESRAAAALLGPAEVTAEVTALGAPDGAVAGDADLPRRLGEVLDALSPRIVYAPSPFEMHPDHVASLRATLAALDGRADGLSLLLYEVNTEAMTTFLVDVTPVWPRKRRALEAFASQLGLIDVVDKVDARNRARTVNVDIPAVTHAEAFMELRPEALPAALEHLGRLAEALGLRG